MTRELPAVSAENLVQRRRQLQRERGWKVFQTIWRTLLASGLATGLVWTMTRSVWWIRDPAQVEIEGNRFLSPETIHSLLPLQYPLSLLQVQPQTLMLELEASTPVAGVTIQRQLFPPRLLIQVEEREPVAQATLIPQGNYRPTGLETETWGLLDKQGVWMPLELFTELKSDVALPELKVLGMREQYREDWVILYETLDQSPVQITQLDWHDPNNLILHTEIGLVHCGPYNKQFEQQLVAIDHLRNLNQYPEAQGIEYLDLSRPDSPYLKMLKPHVAPTPVAPERQ